MDIAGALQGMQVKAELQGTADVKGEANVKVEVTASSVLLQIVDAMKNFNMGMAGKLTANSPGGNGKSSPDAAPNPNVGSSVP